MVSGCAFLFLTRLKIGKLEWSGRFEVWFVDTVCHFLFAYKSLTVAAVVSVTFFGPHCLLILRLFDLRHHVFKHLVHSIDRWAANVFGVQSKMAKLTILP